MLQRRDLLKTLFVAPVIIPSIHLMGLSRRSSDLLLLPRSFEIVKTQVHLRRRRLSARWTFEQPQEIESYWPPDVEAELAHILSEEIHRESNNDYWAKPFNSSKVC